MNYCDNVLEVGMQIIPLNLPSPAAYSQLNAVITQFIVVYIILIIFFCTVCF